MVETKTFIGDLTERKYRIETVQTCKQAEDLFLIGPLDHEKMLIFLAALLSIEVQCQVSRRLDTYDHEGFAVGVEISSYISDPILENSIFRNMRMAGNSQEWHRVNGNWLIHELNRQMSQKYEVFTRLECKDVDPPSYDDPMSSDHFFID